jgi:hypothetical protein
MKIIKFFRKNEICFETVEEIIEKKGIIKYLEVMFRLWNNIKVD